MVRAQTRPASQAHRRSRHSGRAVCREAPVIQHQYSRPIVTVGNSNLDKFIKHPYRFVTLTTKRKGGGVALSDAWASAAATRLAGSRTKLEALSFGSELERTRNLAQVCNFAPSLARSSIVFGASLHKSRLTGSFTLIFPNISSPPCSGHQQRRYFVQHRGQSPWQRALWSARQ